MCIRSAGVFLVELSFAFQRTPVRGNALFAFGDIFFGCTSRDTDKNAGGDGSAEGGVMLFSHKLAYLVNRNELAPGDGFY